MDVILKSVLLQTANPVLGDGQYLGSGDNYELKERREIEKNDN